MLIKLITSEEILLKGTQLLPVHSQYPYTGDVYVEARIRNAPGNEYFLHQGVYSLTEGKGHILVSNISSAVILKINTTLSRALFLGREI